MLQDILQFFQGKLFLPDLVLEFIALALVVLVALPVHEMAHGFAAYRLGDMTAKNMGRLTMNPLPIWTLRYADDFSFRVWLCEACPGKSQSIPQSQSGNGAYGSGRTGIQPADGGRLRGVVPDFRPFCHVGIGG